jgi:hypothetical protein
MSDFIYVLKRHVIDLHPNEAKSLNLVYDSDDKSSDSKSPMRKKNLIKIPMTRHKVNKFFVKLLTTHNMPINFLGYEAVGEFFDDMFNELDIKMYPKKGTDLLSNTASSVRKLIQNELQNSLFSLKMDSAKRCGRKVLGKCTHEF